MKTIDRIKFPINLLIVFIIACSIFYLSHLYDNKYTARGAQPISGILILDENKLELRPVIWLVRGWEIYRDRLLTPEDFIKPPTPVPDEYVFIGQYGGFEGRVTDTPERSPHGSATYRLVIKLPSDIRSYTLELPEIYSAYKLYINGTLLKKMGETDPENYRARTGSSSITFQASDKVEIIFAVSGFDHFYCGMVYPPAFGEAEAVARVLNTRLAVRYIACILALVLGLLYFGVWSLTRKTKNSPGILPLHYAALCLCFVIYTSYPIVKTLWHGSIFWYTIENFAYCAMFLFIIQITRRLTGANEKWSRPFEAYALFMCCWALTMPFIMGDSLNAMMFYSRLIEWYSWVCAIYLTISTAYGVFKNRAHSKSMLVAIMVFNAAFVMQIIMPRFEPILFGWYTEIAGAFVVLMVGAVLTTDIAGQYRLRQAMESRVESVTKMLEVQRAYIPILTAKEEETRIARHDIRHHMNMIRELVPPVPQNEKLKEYLDAYQDKQTQSVQVRYCIHDFTNMILGMYAGLAKQQDTEFVVNATLPETISIDDVDLCVILSNLLENALEASIRLQSDKRYVEANIGYDKGMLGIFVKNNFDGELNRKNNVFYSGKQSGRIGLGLRSVETVCKRLNGSAGFYSEKNVFHSDIFIPEVNNT